MAVATFGLAACSSSSSHGKPTAAQQPSISTGQQQASSAAAQPANSSATSSQPSASSGGSTTLGSVDACTLLTAADFAAATNKVQPSGFSPSKYTLTTEKTTTDVSAAVEQHSACTYHFSGEPGDTGELTLDVMTAAEYHSLGTFEPGKPIAGLGDEAAVFGERPAFLLGNRGALIANSSSTIAFGTELLRNLASHFS